MSQLINEFISAALQLIVFTLIPFIFFLFRKNKAVNFKQYIGFYKAPSLSLRYASLISVFFLISGISLIYIDDGFREIVFSPTSVTGKLRQSGLTMNSVIILLIIALFKTSLSEEIFFRGFLAKRLINGLGFRTGNILQALIFGLVHLILVWKLIQPGISGVVLIFFFSTLAGWAIGLIKEKYADGSIFPGWLAHGLGNTLSYAIIAYLV